MKRLILIFTTAMVSLLLLAGCFSGEKDPVKEMMPSETPKADPETPIGGDPAATAPSKDMDIVDEVQRLMQEADAKKLALERVPGATEEHIREWKKEVDDGKQVYEGKIVMDKTEYEFELDAHTGEVITWESEPVKDE